MSDTVHVLPPAPMPREQHERSVRSIPAGTFGGCPSWFRARCRESARCGTDGYAHAGEALGRAVYTLAPLDIEDDDWVELIDAELLPAARSDDGGAMLAWLLRRFPKCMTQVPVRRRSGFVAGFARGLLDIQREGKGL